MTKPSIKYSFLIQNLRKLLSILNSVAKRQSAWSDVFI